MKVRKPKEAACRLGSIVNKTDKSTGFVASLLEKPLLRKILSLTAHELDEAYATKNMGQRPITLMDSRRTQTPDDPPAWAKGMMAFFQSQLEGVKNEMNKKIELSIFSKQQEEERTQHGRHEETKRKNDEKFGYYKKNKKPKPKGSPYVFNFCNGPFLGRGSDSD